MPLRAPICGPLGISKHSLVNDAQTVLAQFGAQASEFTRFHATEASPGVVN
jgi:hypothetical protein